MYDIRIFDDILSQSDIDMIYVLIAHDSSFPWYMQSNTVHYAGSPKIDISKYTNPSFFGHSFIRNNEIISERVDIVYVLLEKFFEKTGLEKTNILRAQINIAVSGESTTPTAPHVDTNVDHYVLLYYINDSDGDTIIYEDDSATNVIQRISPKMGRFVLFDGAYYHSGTFPQKNRYRYVFNINLEKKK
jgi:hypothetical protein